MTGRDECREVTLPSGEPIRVRGAGELTPEAVSALGELVDAARARMAAEHPPNPAAEALWARLTARKDTLDISLFAVARECGLAPSVLFRIGQGQMPNETDLAALELWLTGAEPQGSLPNSDGRGAGPGAFA